MSKANKLLNNMGERDPNEGPTEIERIRDAVEFLWGRIRKEDEHGQHALETILNCLNRLDSTQVIETFDSKLKTKDIAFSSQVKEVIPAVDGYILMG